VGKGEEAGGRLNGVRFHVRDLHERNGGKRRRVQTTLKKHKKGDGGRSNEKGWAKDDGDESSLKKNEIGQSRI